jgi:RHS repeat-associated protein
MTTPAFRLLIAFLGSLFFQDVFAADPESSPDFARICPEGSLPVEPGDVPVNPGLLWNAARSGTGWTIAYSPIGPTSGSTGLNIHLIWYTYRSDGSGSPVWYLSDTTEISASNGSPGTFEAPLYEYTWALSEDAGSRASKGQNPIGFVRGYFSSRDQSRLALEWKLSGEIQYTSECLTDFSREFHPDPGAALRSIGPQPLGVNLAFNGAYYNAANSGWGLLQHVIRTNGLADQSLYQESLALALYDAQGRATWVLGLDGDGADKDPPAVGQEAELDLTVYRAPSTFDPHATCPQANSSCSATPAATGIWRRTFLDSNTLDAQLSLTSNTHNIAIAGFNYQSPPAPGQSQPSPVARLTRLTLNNYIVVDRAPCVAYPGQSTCNVSINWSIDPSIASSACIRQVVTTAGVPNVGQNCLQEGYGHHGELDIAIDPLVYGLNTSKKLSYHLTSVDGLSTYSRTPLLYAVASTLEDPLALMLDADHPGSEAQAPHTPGLTRLPGAAGVSGGAATYSVPIEVPPGRRGMQPSVSLEYSSRAGNGIAGMGFSLSAGGSIHRCPQTLEQDGFVRAVRLDNQDRLCLDGQRLRAVESTYGAAGAVYATEIDSFARVRQLGGNLSSTSTYFEVRTKDGEVRTYGTIGSAAGAVVRPRGSSGDLAPLSWMLAERRDTLGTNVGNTERYVYGTAFPESSLPGAPLIPEVLLTEIRYTGYRSPTSFTEGNRTVKFLYEPRPDRSSSFIGGGVLWQAQRLSRIQTWAPAAASASAPGSISKVREYRLEYDGVVPAQQKAAVPNPQLPPVYSETSLSSGRTLLRSITEVAMGASGSHARSPTVFTWQDGVLQAEERSTSELVAGSVNTSGLINGYAPVRVVGDFNGDGHRDLLARGANGESILLTLGASRQVIEAIDVTAALGGTGIDDGRITSQWFTDVDLDARQDLLGYEPDATRPVEQDWELVIYRSEPSVSPGGGFDQFFPAKRRIRTGIKGDRSRVVGAQRMVDFNSDGYPDILWSRRPSELQGCDYGAYTLLLNLRNGSFQAPTAGTSFCLGTFHGGGSLGTQLLLVTEDVNGDGIVDVVLGAASGDPGEWGARSTWSGVRLGAVDDQGNYSFGALSRLGVIFPGEGNDPQPDQLWGYGAGPQLSAPLLFQRGDFNGDGLSDLVWAAKRTNTSQTLEWVFRLNTGAGFGPKVWSGRSDGLKSIRNEILINADLIRISDTNSDGKDELIIPTGFAQALCQYVVRPDDTPTGGAAKAPGPNPQPGVCTNFSELPIINRLVHPDQRFAGCIIDDLEPDPGLIEVNANQPEELYACPEHPETGENSFSGETGRLVRFPDHEGATNSSERRFAVPMFATGRGSLNSSTYTYSSLDIEFRKSGGGLAVEFGPRRTVPHAFVPSEDLFSDGLADGLGSSGCKFRDPGQCSRIAPEDVRPNAHGIASHDHAPQEFRYHFSESLGVGVGGAFSLGAPLLPDLLSSVAEPVAGAYSDANIFEWRYSPLSGLAARDKHGLAIYSLQPPDGDTSNYADARHFYFTSSMPVVAEFSRPAGVRNAKGQPLQNTTLYGYGQAMYHVFGRGFQGFRSIHEWDLAQGTALETVFHQRFPLTSRIERQTLSVLYVDGSDAALGKPLSKTFNTWACDRDNRGACPANGHGWGGGFPFLDKEVVETFDAALAQAGTEAPAISRRTVTYANWSGLTPNACPTGSAAGAGYDSYGNLLYKFELLEDLGSDAKLAKACSMEQHEYRAAETAAHVWWVNRLEQSTQQRRVEYSSQHVRPAGVSDADVNPRQSRRSVFAWNGTTRLLDRQDEQLISSSGTETLTTSSFFYPSNIPENCAGTSGFVGANYGLPSCVRVSRGSSLVGGADSAAINLAGASPANRETRTEYTSDGYFPTSVRNALGHTVSTQTRPRDGQPSEATDANGLKTVMEHDAFGFLQRTRYPQLSGSQTRQPDVAVGLQACGSAGVNCAGIADAYYRQQTSALGAPTRMQYFDALGREIASEAEAASESMVEAGSPRFVRSGVFHNRRGLVTRQAAPFAISGFGATAEGWPNAYTEFSDFDVLGRARMKREHNMNRAGIAQPDSPILGDRETAADRVTRYTFTGRVTSISAYAERNGVQTGRRTLSREVDGLGRHLRTTDAHESNPEGAGGTTRYWFDAWGQPVAIKDAKDAVTRAVHDAAGRRHATHDPNQGTSTYLYSGFGELLRQVDARGVKQDYYYDTLGRQVRRKVSLTNTSCSFSNPDALQVSAEYDKDCASTTDDYFFFDGAIDRHGEIGSASAKGLPSGHERLITTLGIPHSERRVWDLFDEYGRVVARNTIQDLKAKNGALTYSGKRQYTHRYKYDSRFGRLLGEAWPNGVGRGFRYSSIGAVREETGHGDHMPPVLRMVGEVNVLGTATLEWIGDHTFGAALEVRRTQNLATGELESIDYARDPKGLGTASRIWYENYRFDAFGNLVRRAQQQQGGGTFAEHEAYSYDLLHRMTQSRLITNGDAAPVVDLGYDLVGNLQKKTDFSTPAASAYAYPTDLTRRPNAVSQVSLKNGGVRQYRYDASGNLVCQYGTPLVSNCGSHQEFQAFYNHNQQPSFQQRRTVYGVNGSTYSQTWYTYGADQQPARQWGSEKASNCDVVVGGRLLPCLGYHRIYLDRYEDTVGAFRHFDNSERQYRARAYIGDYLVATRGRYGELELSYLMRDRLGSVVGVEGVELVDREIRTLLPETRHGFDAYGAPRSNRKWSVSTWRDEGSSPLPTRTQQGFTGHERLSGLQLIHMKGRVFDSALGRFHGVDPIIQFPLSSQGLNPYTYILNNPMAGVDPTGYCVAETGTRIKDCVRVTEHRTDGSSRTRTYNTKSSGDMALANATPIRGVGSNGAKSGAQRQRSGEASDISSVAEAGKSEGGSFSNGEVTGAMGYAYGQMANRRLSDGSSDPGAESRENPYLRDKMTFVDGPNGRLYSATGLTMTYDPSISGEVAAEYAALASNEWTVSYVVDGKSVASTVSISATGAAADLASGGADLHLSPCRGNGCNQYGQAELGGRVLYLSPGQLRTTPAHEVGHIFGLGHDISQMGFSGTIMSRSFNRKVTPADINLLFDLYGR